MSDIADWLRNLALGEHIQTFADHDVDMAALPHLTEGMLKEMGLSIGVRAKLMAAIAGLAPSEPVAEDNGARISPGAERRNLTVVFFDLVGSTALSEALDPEDLRALIRAYQSVAAGVIARYEGHIAQYLGDGILVYFGWPAAHEDDAERALRAGLELIEAVKTVEGPAPIRLRVGIATGLVVIGESGEDGIPIAIGETPNLAARLQGLAGIGEVIVSSATRDLVGSVFDFADAGTHELKGLSEPVAVWRVAGLARAQGRFEAHIRHLAPFVGRDPEIRMLLDRWADAKEGEGQVVLLEAEPGFGKSRMVRELCHRISREPHSVLQYQCSPYHASAALHPVIEQLERAAGFEPGDDDDVRLDKMEAVLPDSDQIRALYASLLSLRTSRYGRLSMTPQKQKELTLQALAANLETMSAKQPVLLLVEDAHWIDPTTQEAFDLQFPLLARLPVLAIVTFRPEYEAPWLEMSHVTPLRLSRMSKRHAIAMVAASNSSLSPEQCAQIVEKADGIPLFVEEITHALQNKASHEQGDARAPNEPGAPMLEIPRTLQDSLTARIDRLGSLKELAQVAACIGREFTYSLLASVMPGGTTDLDAELAALVESGLVFPQERGEDARFAFKHFLVQQAAYSSLLKTTRRNIHSAIASALVAKGAKHPGTDQLLIAQHLRAAGQLKEALPWLHRAAGRAASAGSVKESLEILDRAIELVGEFDGPVQVRERAELETLMVRLPVCIAIKGWASDDANATCSRALALAESLGDRDTESSILYHMATMHEVRGEYSKTQEVLGRRFRILRQPPEPEPAVESGELMACSTFYQGRFTTSIAHATEALHYADPENQTRLGASLSEDPLVACLFWLAKSLLLQGLIDQSQAKQHEAMDCAQRSTAWYARSQADVDAAMLSVFRRDINAALDHAKQAADSSARVGLAYREAVAAVVQEWARAQAQKTSDLKKVDASLRIFREVGAMIGYGFYLGLAAEAHACVGEMDRSIELIDEAIASCGDTRGFFYESELYRLKGDFKLMHNGLRANSSAEYCFERSLQIARSQGARLFELRTAVSFGDMRIRQGRNANAAELITPLLEDMCEGMESYDVKRARTVLTAAG